MRGASAPGHGRHSEGPSSTHPYQPTSATTYVSVPPKAFFLEKKQEAMGKPAIALLMGKQMSDWGKKKDASLKKR